MKILDGYLVKNFFVIFFLGLIVTALLFLVIAVFDNLSRLFASENLPISMIILRYFYEEPRILYMAMPMALLVSVSIVLGLLDQRNELIVIKAAGISLSRLSLPLMLCSVVIMILMYAFGDYLVPLSSARIEEIKCLMRGEEPEMTYRGGYIWHVSDDNKNGLRIFRILRKNSSDNIFTGFSIFDFDHSLKLKTEVQAEQAVYDEGLWLLSGVHKWDYSAGPAASYETLDTLELSLSEKPRHFQARKYKPEEMTTRQLRHHLKRIRRYGLDEREYWVELRLRQALPWACVIMALLAIPFSLRPKRTSGLILNLLFAVVIAFVYFAVIGESISLAKNGTLPPAFGAWIANAIFGIIGLLMFSGTRQ